LSLPIKKLYPQLLFEALYHGTQRRLRYVTSSRSFGKLTVLVKGNQILKLLEGHSKERFS